MTNLRDEGTGYLAPPRQVRRSDDRRNELSDEVTPVINMAKDYPYKLDFAKVWVITVKKMGTHQLPRAGHTHTTDSSKQ